MGVRSRLGMLGQRAGRLVDGLVRRPAWWWLAGAFWAALAAASFAWHAHDLNGYAYATALQRGRLVMQMVETMRHWAAQQSQRTGIADNSATMTRELGEIIQAERDQELRIHITSLKLLNPANAPDPWEAQALKDFEHGIAERHGIDGADFRYMAPLPTKASCLECHAHQGYRVGDVRGGLSVSFPARRIDEIVGGQRRALVVIHLVAVALLSSLSLISLFTLRRRLLAIDAARADLLESEKMASLGRMVAGFAHEVNTPVGVAVAAASQIDALAGEFRALLQRDEVEATDIEAILKQMDESTDLTLANLRRAAAMVQSFKRTAVDQQSEAPREFTLAEVIDDVARNLHNVFKKTPIKLAIDCPPGLTAVGHVGALEQVLTNLFENARIHAFAEGTRAGTLAIVARCEGHELVLSVRDDGAGMPAETVAHIFEPFFTTRRGQGGSGLGLYIVYNMVIQELGGSIGCESHEGRGTVFHIRFPLHARNAPRTPP